MKKIKIILTESFIPFLIAMVLFMIGLLLLDRHIENKDDVMIIELDHDKDLSQENFYITQRVEISGNPNSRYEWIKQLNQLIDSKLWNEAIQLINEREPNLHASHEEIKITMAFLHYKTGSYKKGIDLLKSMNFKKSPRYFYNLGLLYSHDERYFLDAITAFERFLTFKNNSYETLMNIAGLYYQLKNYEKSIATYNQAAQVSSMSRKAKALFWKAACLEKTNRDQEALGILDFSIKLDPDFPPARVKREKLRLKKEPAKAIAQLKKLAQVYPDYTETYMIIVNYYIESNNFAIASEWLKEALRQSPNSRVIKSNLGNVYLKLDEFEKAQKIFLDLSQQYPDEENYHFNLARAYSGLKNYKNAQDEYNKALKIKPVYYEAFVNLGIVHARLENFEEAIKYYQNALKLNSKNPRIFYNIGILYGKKKLWDKALEAYSNAISLNENFAEAYFNKALIYSRSGDIKNAESLYLKAIKVNPDYNSAYINLSQMYEKRGDFSKSTQLLTKAVSRIDNAQILNRLADSYKANKENEKALKTCQKILKKYPENESALFSLADIYLNEKKYELSKKAVEKYLLTNPKNQKARYIYLVDLYNLGMYIDAKRQYEVILKLPLELKKKYEMKDLENIGQNLMNMKGVEKDQIN